MYIIPCVLVLTGLVLFGSKVQSLCREEGLVHTTSNDLGSQKTRSDFSLPMLGVACEICHVYA